MATYFSSAFSGTSALQTTSTNGTATLVQGKFPARAGAVHGRTRTSIGRLKFDSAVANFTTADVAHLFPMRPNDRLVSLEYKSDDVGTAGTMDVGLYEVSIRDGVMNLTASDANLFATAVALNTSAVTSWTEVMHESGTVPIEYVGAPLWEIADLGDGNYTATTDKTFVISVTPAENSTTSFDLVFRAEYVSGD